MSGQFCTLAMFFLWPSKTTLSAYYGIKFQLKIVMKMMMIIVIILMLDDDNLVVQELLLYFHLSTSGAAVQEGSINFLVLYDSCTSFSISMLGLAAPNLGLLSPMNGTIHSPTAVHTALLQFTLSAFQFQLFSVDYNANSN